MGKIRSERLSEMDPRAGGGQESEEQEYDSSGKSRTKMAGRLAAAAPMLDNPSLRAFSSMLRVLSQCLEVAVASPSSGTKDITAQDSVRYGTVWYGAAQPCTGAA